AQRHEAQNAEHRLCRVDSRAVLHFGRIIWHRRGLLVATENGMKSFRWTLVAAGLVAALVAFTLYDNKRVAKKEELGEKEKSMLKMPVEKVVSIEIINRVAPITLERPNSDAKGPGQTPREWRVKKPVDDAAEQQAVQSFLSNIESEKSLQTVVSGDDLAKTG